MHADIRVRVQPRAKREGIGRRGEQIVVRVAAPPVDNRANDAVCKALAAAAGVPPSCVTVIKGHAAREKTIRAEGVAPEELERKLA
jgi:uncharacterized protein (TIGR00251 family)